MRPPIQIDKLREFMAALGRETLGMGRIYLTGGATALLYGWRPMTVDIDPASFAGAVMAFVENTKGENP